MYVTTTAKGRITTEYVECLTLREFKAFLAAHETADVVVSISQQHGDIQAYITEKPTFSVPGAQ